jgi:type IV fimbrial biogenesis protein FimT
MARTIPPYASAATSDRGFTLIEVMIAVAIVTVLVSIALPSYSSVMLKLNRTAGQQFMMDVANREEQIVIDQRAFTTTIGTGGLGLTPTRDVAANYTFAVADWCRLRRRRAAARYAIRAIMIGAQSNDGNLCLDSRNNKTRPRNGQLIAARRGLAGGFTLIELLITVSVIALLTTLALPSLRNLIQQQHVRAGASDLQAALFFARSEAVKRASSVEVVPASNDWKSGWTVQLASGTVLRSRLPLNPQLASMGVTAGTKVTYLPDGHLTSAPAAVAFRVTTNTAVKARCVITDLSGRPSVVSDTDGDPSNGCT